MVAPSAETIFGQLQHLFSKILNSPLPEGRFQCRFGDLYKKDISARKPFQRRFLSSFEQAVRHNFDGVTASIPQNDVYQILYSINYQ